MPFIGGDAALLATGMWGGRGGTGVPARACTPARAAAAAQAGLGAWGWRRAQQLELASEERLEF